jgi:DNA repair exonuclease SbcCD ATPase subunit
VAASRKKPAKGAAGKARASARGLPDERGDAPLDELSRDALSVFLYVALLPEETKAIVRDLGLSVPGFRTEALSEVELCDVLADEIRAVPSTRAHVVEKLRAAFGGMPIPDVPLDPAGADDLLAVGSSEHGLTFAVWRVLADPDPEVRGRASPVLERLVKDHYGPRSQDARGRPEAPPKDDPSARISALEKEIAEARRELEEARARAEGARRKGDEQRDKLQGWLKEARAREAQAVEDAARAREAATEAQRAKERTEAALAAAQATDAAAEAQRARGLARDLEGKVTSLEARLRRQEERERELEAAVAEARSQVGAERAAPAAAASAEENEVEEAPATWLMPVYTREFYDSLEGWDRRVQRAAFKQANLLAQDHRHPSLRALPLEGLPGYYRVRVATDVRLLYRRTERQNTIEILSLIDREDLDRYVRQAKTRSG